ncbi:hypothetical protein J3A83DRAFT_4185653 [Scleroderma citrinum]
MTPGGISRGVCRGEHAIRRVAIQKEGTRGNIAYLEVNMKASDWMVYLTGFVTGQSARRMSLMDGPYVCKYEKFPDANRHYLDEVYSSRSSGSEIIWFGKYYKGYALCEVYFIRFCLDPGKQDCRYACARQKPRWLSCEEAVCLGNEHINGGKRAKAWDKSAQLDAWYRRGPVWSSLNHYRALAAEKLRELSPEAYRDYADNVHAHADWATSALSWQVEPKQGMDRPGCFLSPPSSVIPPTPSSYPARITQTPSDSVLRCAVTTCHHLVSAPHGPDVTTTLYIPHGVDVQADAEGDGSNWKDDGSGEEGSRGCEFEHTRSDDVEVSLSDGTI